MNQPPPSPNHSLPPNPQSLKWRKRSANPKEVTTLEDRKKRSGYCDSEDRDLWLELYSEEQLAVGRSSTGQNTAVNKDGQ
ncbi:hypothetical protein AURDEDRAFT_165436 [Auricularia subglabra TFB-10046 SS5]|nr:hypothetical protein AURDEDRAFT_165436 [Auricularia subglabra TFB-10046 SS5]